MHKHDDPLNVLTLTDLSTQTYLVQVKCGDLVVSGLGSRTCEKVVINRLRVRLLAMHCRVRTCMGDHLWVGKPSRYVTSHLGQLSLPSLRGRKIEYWPA